MDQIHQRMLMLYEEVGFTAHDSRLLDSQGVNRCTGRFERAVHIRNRDWEHSSYPIAGMAFKRRSPAWSVGRSSPGGKLPRGKNSPPARHPAQTSTSASVCKYSIATALSQLAGGENLARGVHLYR